MFADLPLLITVDYPIEENVLHLCSMSSLVKEVTCNAILYFLLFLSFHEFHVITLETPPLMLWHFACCVMPPISNAS